MLAKIRLYCVLKLLTIFTKSSILDIWIDSKYTYVFWKYLKVKDFVISVKNQLHFIALNWTCNSKTSGNFNVIILKWSYWNDHVFRPSEIYHLFCSFFQGILQPIFCIDVNKKIKKWKIIQNLFKKSYFCKMFKFLLTIFTDIIPPVTLSTQIACDVMRVQYVIH